MKYIDSEKLIAKLTKMQFDLNAAYRHPQSDSIVRAISLEYDDVLSLIISLQQEQQEFPTTDEEVEKVLASIPKVELPDKYKTPDWLFKQQEQPDTCIFGNTPSEEACKFCGVNCELRQPKQSGITSTNLSSTNEAVGLAIMAYLDTKVKHDNAKVCGVSLRVAREWIREKIANKQEQPEVDLEQEVDSYIENERYFPDDERHIVVEIARHFYELGCTRTAEMYDDIEYNRQRAEEAELSGDLDEEVKRYWNEHALEYRIGRVADIDFLLLAARHFYELGRNVRKSIWHNVAEEIPTKYGSKVIVACRNKNKEDGIWLYDLIQYWEGKWEPRVNWETPIKWAYVRDLDNARKEE